MEQRPVLVALAEVADSVRFDDLPQEVVRYTKALILDSLGCAFGGFDSDVCAAVRTMVEEFGGRPDATVIGSGARTSVPLATLANGAMLRYLDSNDYYFSRDPAHPSGNLPVALALGEKLKCTGEGLIAALVAAYEIHLRFCTFAGEPTLWRRGWHHGTNAQFSAAALAARLLKKTPAVIAHAMAIAGSHHNTLAQLQGGQISMIKATAEAWVAKGGVEAAFLAAHGVTGPLELLEGKAGWASTVAGAVDFEKLVAPLDGHYRLMDVCIKPYPAVATAMAPIQAALDLHPLVRDRVDEIERVDVRLPAFALGTPSAGPDRRIPTTRESADHSFYYCVAISLLEGACGDAQFEEGKLSMPQLRRLLAKVELVEDPQFSTQWPAAAGGAVEIHLSGGERFARRYEYPPGHRLNPLSAAAIGHKYHTAADAVLSRGRATALQDLVNSLELCADVRQLSGLLAPPEASDARRPTH